MLVMRGAVLPTGGLSRSSLVGRSVARARAPNVSIMRLTHNSWTAVRGTSPAETAAIKLITKAATFTTSTACLTSGRHGSFRPTIPNKVKASSLSFGLAVSSSYSTSSSETSL